MQKQFSQRASYEEKNGWQTPVGKAAIADLQKSIYGQFMLGHGLMNRDPSQNIHLRSSARLVEGTNGDYSSDFKDIALRSAKSAVHELRHSWQHKKAEGTLPCAQSLAGSHLLKNAGSRCI